MTSFVPGPVVDPAGGEHALHRGDLVVVDFERIPGVTREWLMDHVRAGKDVFTAEIVPADGADTGFAGTVEGVTLVVVDDEQRAVFRLNTVGIRRLSFIQQQTAFP